MKEQPGSSGLETAKNLNATESGFLKMPGEGLWGGDCYRFETLPSTNAWAMANGDKLAHGDVVWALFQSRGRGRLDRQWDSRPNKVLTISVILHRPVSGMITSPGQLAALGVRRLLQERGVPALIKWPNDILSPGMKKIAGILVNANPKQNLAVLGIGLNVNLDEPDLKSLSLDGMATSLYLVTKQHASLNELRISLSRQIMSCWHDNETETVNLFAEWSDHDALDNMMIEVRTQHGIRSGLYQGLDSQGRLVLIDDRGGPHFFWSGDVERVRPFTPNTE